MMAAYWLCAGGGTFYAGVDGSRWVSRSSTPLRGGLRRPGRVRLPRTPATDFVATSGHSRALGDPFAADRGGRSGGRARCGAKTARTNAVGLAATSRESGDTGVRAIGVVTRSVRLCTMAVPAARRDREGGNRWATRARRIPPRRRSRRRTPRPRRSSRSSSYRPDTTASIASAASRCIVGVTWL